jgi:uncharacterized repeat protein (TIGR01451 family)
MNKLAISSALSLFLCAGAAHAQLVAGFDDAAAGVTTAHVYDFNSSQWIALWTDQEVNGLAADDAGRRLFVTNATNLYVWSYDNLGQNVAPTLVGTTNLSGVTQVITGLAWNSATGKLYGSKNIANEAIYEIDPLTGACTIVLDYADAEYDLVLDYNPVDGLLYACNDTGTTHGTGLFKIDLTAQTIVPVVTPYPAFTGMLNDVDGLAIGVMGGQVRAYFVTDDPGEFGVYNITTSQQETSIPSPWLTSEVFSGGAWAPGLVTVPNIDARVSIAAPVNCSLTGPGQQGTFTVTASNNGQTPVSNATVTFTMPAGATFVSSVPAAAPVGNTVTANLGGLATGASATLSVTMVLNNTGTNTGSATVTITEADELSGNNSASASTFIPAAAPTSAVARGLLSNVAGQANSDVPGFPGQRFSTTGFERPWRSADGSRFVMLADTDAATTADQVLLVGTSGGISVGAREGDIGPDGFSWGVFDNVAGVNNSGHFVFSNNTTNPTTTADEVVVKWDGTQFTHVIVEGDAIPNTAFTWGTTSGSATIQNDGTVSVQANMAGTGGTLTDTGVLSANGANLRAQEGTTVPTNQIGGGFTVKAFDTGATDGQGFFVSADGAHYLWSGTVNDATSQDKVVVVDNDVKIQEGGIINGSSFGAPVTTVLFSHMESNADWFAYGANSDTSDYAVRNGVVVGTNGQPIHAGSTELWSDLPYAQCFFLLVGGTTNATNGKANAVVVLNGQTVVARENDPVDVNNDGIFNDDLYIRTFVDDYAALSGTDLYLVVRLRNGSDAAGCTTTDVEQGMALIRIPIGGGNPCPGNECGSQDYNGDGDFGTDQDIEAFFACLGGNCCATCFCQGSDFNGDGDFGTDQDIEAFFRVLGGGNC